MNTTQTYHNQTTFTNQPQTSFGESLAAFLSKHARVFESLTRGDSPYGESIRSDSIRSIEPSPAGRSPHQQIAQLQQQVNDLS